MFVSILASAAFGECLNADASVSTGENYKEIAYQALGVADGAEATSNVL